MDKAVFQDSGVYKTRLDWIGPVDRILLLSIDISAMYSKSFISYHIIYNKGVV